MNDKLRAHAPDYMTGAELQTIREALHLTREDLADLAGVAARTVKHWESGRSGVPADVAETVTRMDALATREASNELERLRHLPQSLDAPHGVGDVVLTRYRGAAGMTPALRASLGGMAAWIQAAIVARVRAKVLEHGASVRVVWFDPQDYEAWRSTQGLDDSHGARMIWAQQALENQAKPHRSDQPPG